MRIATLNTWGRRGPAERRWQLLCEQAADLELDVLCLQELVRDDDLERLAALGLAHALRHAAAGLAIASRLPLADMRTWDYRTQGPSERAPRGVASARIERPGLSVVVATTHLSWLPEDAPRRLDQARELASWLRAEPWPAIVGGDLNDTPESDTVRALRDAGLVDAFAHAHPGEAGLTWARDNPFTSRQQPTLPDRRIDYLLLDERLLEHRQLRAERVFDRPDAEGIFASDHYGVMLELRSRRAASGGGSLAGETREGPGGPAARD